MNMISESPTFFDETFGPRGSQSLAQALSEQKPVLKKRVVEMPSEIYMTERKRELPKHRLKLTIKPFRLKRSPHRQSKSPPRQKSFTFGKPVLVRRPSSEINARVG